MVWTETSCALIVLRGGMPVAKKHLTVRLPVGMLKQIERVRVRSNPDASVRTKIEMLLSLALVTLKTKKSEGCKNR